MVWQKITDTQRTGQKALLGSISAISHCAHEVPFSSHYLLLPTARNSKCTSNRLFRTASCEGWQVSHCDRLSMETSLNEGDTCILSIGTLPVEYGVGMQTLGKIAFHKLLGRVMWVLNSSSESFSTSQMKGLRKAESLFGCIGTCGRIKELIPQLEKRVATDNMGT